jgi:gliding motility-associated-like protein
VNLKLVFLFLLFSFTIQSQCFDCAKNLGGWVDDYVSDLKKTADGLYLIKNSGNFGEHAGIYKYDYNCNLLWGKKIDNFEVYASKLTSDNQGNIYLLITWAGNNYSPPFPKYFNDFPMFQGLNLYKFDKNGTLIWNKPIGTDAQYGMKDLFIYNDTLYLTGTFYNSITINNQITLTNSIDYASFSHPPLLFISKFNLNGDLLEAQKFGSGYDEYTSAEMDKNGNMYFSKYSTFISNYTHQDIDKIDSDLKIVWTKEISNNKVTTESVFRPTFLHYSPNNNKLYLWGAFYKSANILGHIFTDPTNVSYVTQSILSEFNITNGSLERIKQINNTSSLDIPGFYGSGTGNTAYITERENELYIFSSFTGTMEFPNAIVKSNTYYNGMYNDEDLVLFKINLNTFDSEFVLKSYGTNYSTNGMSTDAAGPILFNGNDLYLTSTFRSSPLTINNSVINNNSGNNDSDVMLYKYKLDTSINSGEIIVKNTCFNTPTSFKVNGEFDSILWNFGDPNSTINNTSNTNNPQHQFTTIGTYNVSAVIKCGSETQTLQKEITITGIPNNNSLNPIYACEANSGSGISNSFDTSDINTAITANQSNLVVEYYDSNGSLLPSPLPNPYTNTHKNEEVIRVRSYFQNNPYCFVETNLKLFTISKPSTPTATSPQTFCIQQNTTINDIVITGQNIKWFDQLTAGNLLLNTTPLQNGTTYYASQTINGCESERISVIINIQNTLAPTGIASQNFCTSQNPTLSNLIVVGTAIKWYNNPTLVNLLTDTTPLVDGKTYYATQTENTCESTNGLAVTVSLISSLPANNHDFSICDDLNDGTENVKIDDFNTHLISNTTNYNFIYYKSLSDAENEITANKVTTVSNYKLALGENKIYVRINSNTPCYAIAVLKITLLSKPIIPIQDIVPICENKSILIDAGIGADNYLWSNDKTTQTITVDNPGDLSVTVTKNHATISCFSDKSFTVKTSNIAKITTIETKDWTDNDNTIIVFVTGSGDYEYSIDGTNYQASNHFFGVNSGEYTIQVRDKNGCGTATEEVYLLMYPKFFTPNGDGFNDTWKIKSSDIENGLTLKIFDRFGKLLKELDSNSNGWDGTYIGQTLPATDYWFVVTRENGKEYKGHFSLKR